MKEIPAADRNPQAPVVGMSAHINSFTGSLYLYFEADFCGANLSICLVFAVIHESALCLLRLLLLVELFARSSAHPGQNFSLCSVFGPMIHQVDKLINSSKRLHGLVTSDIWSIILHYLHVVNNYKNVLPSRMMYFQNAYYQESIGNG